MAVPVSICRDTLQQLLAEADAEIDRGELLDGDSVFDEIRQLSQTYRAGKTPE